MVSGREAAVPAWERGQAELLWRTAMVKYRMRIQYAGTRYSGWQIQKDRPTVQQFLQDAIERVCRQRPSVVAAGRTDAGVHAKGQVAHFRLAEPAPAERLLRALNGVLPWDIRVMELREAHPAFHAQRDARKKRYEYRIFNGPVLSPFLHRQALHLRTPLDVEAMQRAAETFRGRHDFKGFAAAASRVKDTRRTVFESRLGKRGRLLVYAIEGEGFLHHMVRNIVGTLLEIGSGRRPWGDVTRIMESKDRRLAGPTAPAEGLFLMRVWY